MQSDLIGDQKELASSRKGSAHIARELMEKGSAGATVKPYDSAVT